MWKKINVKFENFFNFQNKCTLFFSRIERKSFISFRGDRTDKSALNTEGGGITSAVRYKIRSAVQAHAEISSFYEIVYESEAAINHFARETNPGRRRGSVRPQSAGGDLFWRKIFNKIASVGRVNRITPFCSKVSRRVCVCVYALSAAEKIEKLPPQYNLCPIFNLWDKGRKVLCIQQYETIVGPRTVRVLYCVSSKGVFFFFFLRKK